MHFSQRDLADSWLEVVTKIWDYYRFILEEVYKTSAVLPVFRSVCINFWFDCGVIELLLTIPVGFLIT